MLKDVARFVSDDVVNQRHRCHYQAPVQADAAASVTASPAFGLVDYMDGRRRDAEQSRYHTAARWD